MSAEQTNFLESDGDARPVSTPPVDPESLGYPTEYNPYQAQKDRIKAVLAHFDKAGIKLQQLGACYQEFGDEARSETCELLYAALGEMRNMFVQFYVEKM